MEYQTWTRKANALAAVKAFVKANVPNEFLISDIQISDEAPFTARLILDGDEAQAQALAEIVGAKAEIVSEPSVPQSEDEKKVIKKAKAREKKAKAPKTPKPKKHRLGDYQLFMPEDLKNPYRPTSGSYRAIEFLRANNGLTQREVEEAVSHRFKAIWPFIKDGTIERRAPEPVEAAT